MIHSSDIYWANLKDMKIKQGRMYKAERLLNAMAHYNFNYV